MLVTAFFISPLLRFCYQIPKLGKWTGMLGQSFLWYFTKNTIGNGCTVVTVFAVYITYILTLLTLLTLLNIDMFAYI